MFECPLTVFTVIKMFVIDLYFGPCQEIIDDNALASFVSMALNISPENISDIQEVVEKPVKIEFDPSEFEDDDDD